jgi:hypothetical protein
MRKLTIIYGVLFALIFVGIFVNSPIVSADTTISGIISEDTIWTLENSPYIIVGNILVNEGVALTIEPGVVVKVRKAEIGDQYHIKIKGELISVGTEAAKIIFTSEENLPEQPPEDCDEGDIRCEMEKLEWMLWWMLFEGWEGIKLDNCQNWDENNKTGTIIEHTVIEGVGASRSSFAIQINECYPLIKNSTIWKGKKSISINNTGGSEEFVQIFNNKIYNSILINNGNPYFYDNKIYEEVSVRGGGSSFVNNKISGGISISGGEPNFSENNITKKGFFISSGSSVITKNNIIGNFQHSGINICGGTPKITFNNIIKNSVGVFITQEQYAEEEPIVEGLTIEELEYSTTSNTFLISNNSIYNNKHYSIFLQNIEDDISAENNYWGTTDTDSIEALIYDHRRDYTLGYVYYVPFLESPDPDAPDLSETIPVITLIGSSTIVIELGDEFTDPGVTAYDHVDGDITNDITIGGDEVNVDIPGNYILTYNVSNSFGNVAEEVTRTVIVRDSSVILPGEEHQTIQLETGWNVVSTPRVLKSHEFSVSSTVDNFDIYLLDPDSPSGWKTMQEAGQSEFTPLFAYFINNKTNERQALLFNYDSDLDPSQRLFSRTLQPGWNAIGIASPDEALSQGTGNIDTNNPTKILNSIIDSTIQVIDFTHGNNNPDSPAVSSVWKSKTKTDVDLLNDFRELKAYGVFIKETVDYLGSQNTDLIPPPLPPSPGEIEIKKTDSSPLEGIVIVNSNSLTEVELLEFTLEAKDSNFELNEIKITVSDSGNGFVTNKIDDLMLLVGDKTYYAANSGDTFAFDVSDTVLNKGVKETYTVVAKVLNTVSGTNNHWYTGTQLFASVFEGDISGYDTTDTLRTTNGNISGEIQNLYTVVPEFTLVSGVASQIDGSSPKNIAIEFDVKAHGGDIWIATGTGLPTVSFTTGLYNLAGITNATGTTAVSRKSGGTLDTTTAKTTYNGLTVVAWYMISEGNTAKFEVISGDTNLPAATKAYLKQIVWFFDNEVAGFTPVAVPWSEDFVKHLETNRL